MIFSCMKNHPFYPVIRRRIGHRCIPWTFAGDMLRGMRPLMFLLFASMALAQQGEDARPLLQQVADAARNVKSWRAEYVASIEITGEGIQSKMEMPSKESCAGPEPIGVGRSLVAGMPVLIVCDGANTWIYMPALKQYQKTPGTTAACVSLLDRLGGVSWTVFSPPSLPAVTRWCLRGFPPLAMWSARSTRGCAPVAILTWGPVMPGARFPDNLRGPQPAP